MSVFVYLFTVLILNNGMPEVIIDCEKSEQVIMNCMTMRVILISLFFTEIHIYTMHIQIYYFICTGAGWSSMIQKAITYLCLLGGLNK